MARRKTPESIDEQLKKVIYDIEKAQENLKKLKRKKKELEEKKRFEDLDRLGKILDSERISYEEAERRLRQTPDKI